MKRRGFLASLVGLLGFASVKRDVVKSIPHDDFIAKYPLTPEECWNADEFHYYANNKGLFLRSDGEWIGVDLIPKGNGNIILHQDSNDT